MFDVADGHGRVDAGGFALVVKEEFLGAIANGGEGFAFAAAAGQQRQAKGRQEYFSRNIQCGTGWAVVSGPRPIFLRNGSMDRLRPRNFSIEISTSRESPIS